MRSASAVHLRRVISYNAPVGPSAQPRPQRVSRDPPAFMAAPLSSHHQRVSQFPGKPAGSAKKASSKEALALADSAVSIAKCAATLAESAASILDAVSRFLPAQGDHIRRPQQIPTPNHNVSPISRPRRAPSVSRPAETPASRGEAEDTPGEVVCMKDHSHAQQMPTPDHNVDSVSRPAETPASGGKVEFTPGEVGWMEILSKQKQYRLQLEGFCTLCKREAPAVRPAHRFRQTVVVPSTSKNADHKSANVKATLCEPCYGILNYFIPSDGKNGGQESIYAIEEVASDYFFASWLRFARTKSMEELRSVMRTRPTVFDEYGDRGPSAGTTAQGLGGTVVPLKRAPDADVLSAIEKALDEIWTTGNFPAGDAFTVRHDLPLQRLLKTMTGLGRRIRPVMIRLAMGRRREWDEWRRYIFVTHQRNHTRLPPFSKTLHSREQHDGPAEAAAQPLDVPPADARRELPESDKVWKHGW